MNDYKVTYVANRAINNILEGHNIASKRIIDAAKQYKLKHDVITLEEKYIQKNNYKIITISDDKKRKTSFFPQMNEVIKSGEMIKKAQESDSDLIHLLNVNKEIMGYQYFRNKIKKPLIIHLFHSEIPFQLELNYKLRLLLIKKGIYKNILCTNDKLTNYLKKVIPNKDINIKKVPSPINLEKYQIENKCDYRYNMGISDDSKIVLYIGQIDPDRGFFDVIKSFKTIIKQNKNTYLYICHPNLKNETEYYYEYLKNYFKEDFKNIIFSGPQNNIEETYILSDIILLPFRKPYWATAPPLVLPEAMASNTPIITTPVDVIPELNKNNGLLFVAPGNTNNIIQAVTLLLNDQTVGKSLASNAKKLIDEEYEINKVAKKLKKIYDETLE